MTKRHSAVLFLLAGFLAAPLLAEPTFQWTGQGDTDLWSEAGNWSPETIPPAGAHLIFGPVDGEPSPVNDLGDPWVSGSITFAPGAPAYRLGGFPIRLTDTLRNESDQRQTIDLGVIIRMGYPEDGRDGNRPPTIDTGPAGMVLNGPLSSHSGHRDHNPDRLTKVGSGELVLRNNGNTFRGRELFIYEGTLRVEGSRVAPNVVRNIQMHEGTTLSFGGDGGP